MLQRVHEQQSYQSPELLSARHPNHTPPLLPVHPNVPPSSGELPAGEVWHLRLKTQNTEVMLVKCWVCQCQARWAKRVISGRFIRQAIEPERLAIEGGWIIHEDLSSRRPSTWAWICFVSCALPHSSSRGMVTGESCGCHGYAVGILQSMLKDWKNFSEWT